MKQAKKDIPLVTVGLVAYMFGGTGKTIALWHRTHGLPKESHGRYDLKKVFDWYQTADVGKTADDSDSDLLESKKRYWDARADRERLRADLEAGKLVPEEKIIPEWAGRMPELTSGLESLGERLSSLLEGKTRSEMREIIHREQRALRDNYCRTGVFCLEASEGKR